MTCNYCEKNHQLLNLMIPVCSLDTSNVYLVKDQTYMGRCVVAFNKHKSDLHELTPNEQTVFLKELCMVTEALAGLYHPDKINLAVYGDKMPHLHFHVVPKYVDGADFGDPFIANPEFPKYISEDEYTKRVEEIKLAIMENKK